MSTSGFVFKTHTVAAAIKILKRYRLSHFRVRGKPNTTNGKLLFPMYPLTMSFRVDLIGLRHWHMQIYNPMQEMILTEIVEKLHEMSTNTDKVAGAPYDIYPENTEAFEYIISKLHEMNDYESL